MLTAKRLAMLVLAIATGVLAAMLPQPLLVAAFGLAAMSFGCSLYDTDD